MAPRLHARDCNLSVKTIGNIFVAVKSADATLEHVDIALNKCGKEKLCAHMGQCIAASRTLRSLHLVVPNWYTKVYRAAYWNKFGHPEQPPKYDLGLYTWWVDPAKDERLRSEQEQVAEPQAAAADNAGDAAPEAE